jgi:hypothetical protein
VTGWSLSRAGVASVRTTGNTSAQAPQVGAPSGCRCQRSSRPAARSGNASIQARPVSPKNLRCQETSASGTSIRGPTELVRVLRLAQPGGPDRRDGVPPSGTYMGVDNSSPIKACGGSSASKQGKCVALVDPGCAVNTRRVRPPSAEMSRASNIRSMSPTAGWRTYRCPDAGWWQGRPQRRVADSCPGRSIASDWPASRECCNG